MNFQLTDELSSTQDLRAAISEVRSYGKWVGQQTDRVKSGAANPVEVPPISAGVSSLITQWHGGNQPTRQSLDDLIAGLEELLSKAQRITITLAAPAPAKLKNSLVNWCRQNLGQDLLVDFQFNSTMLGGMAVSYNSRIYDWSFRKRILAARSKFPEFLHRLDSGTTNTSPYMEPRSGALSRPVSPKAAAQAAIPKVAHV
jgi:hypothetical protein